MRLRNIDLLKGLLIILVVIGHVIREDMSHSIFRTLIYSFHMPVFIAISGYLFHAERFRSFGELLKKYTLRLMLPWAIAVVGYSWLTTTFQGKSYGVHCILEAFAHPYYHLWFIPAFLAWIFLTWGVKKMGLSQQTFFLLALAVTLFSSYLQYSSYFSSNELGHTLFYTFRPYLYLYFAMGVCYQQLTLQKPLVFIYLCPVFTFLMICYLFYHSLPSHSLLLAIGSLLLSSSSIYLLLKCSVRNALPFIQMIEWIGSHSLFFYLWHVVPIILSAHLFSKAYSVYYGLTILGLELLLIPIYKLLMRSHFLKRYVLGLS